MTRIPPGAPSFDSRCEPSRHEQDGSANRFVVDDDAAVRDSIAELVESVGLQAEGYGSASAFLEAFRPQRPGCLVLDVRMAEMSGLVLQQRLNALEAGIPVIVLTGHGDVPTAVQAMKAGAVDFLQKPYHEQALLDSINTALSLDAAARRSSAAASNFVRCLAVLTERERQVLDHLLAGKTSKEMAKALAISPRTADTHRRNLLRKFGVGSAKDLVRLAASSGGAR
jgi:FixJ family two-component response regulator